MSGKKIGLILQDELMTVIGDVKALTKSAACATLMLKNGADIRYVQEQLGHKRITSTQVYTRLTPLDLKSIHSRCHPRERKNFEGARAGALAEAPSEAPSGDTGFTSAA